MAAFPDVRRHGAFIAACVLALTALGLAYANHFHNGFHFDDSHVIVNNLSIRSLQNVGSYFTDATTFTARPQNAVYRPLLTLSYALDYTLGGGLDPVAFHRTQFILLIVLGALLVPLFTRLADLGRPSPWNRYTALVAATLFCIHTANTETVNYLASRSSLVATLAVAAAFDAYLRWPGLRRTYLYVLPMIVGGLAKPLTIMFAPLLFVFCLFFEERLSVNQAVDFAYRVRVRSALRRTLPVFLLGGVLYVFLAAMNAGTLQYAVIGRWTYLITQPFVWLHYFRLFFLPRGLTADSDWKFLTDWQDWRLLVGLAFIGLLIAAITLLSRSASWRPAAFGLAWFAIALLPTSSVFPLSEVYNEHRIFFPYVGLAFASVWLVASGLERVGARRGKSRVTGLVAALLAVLLLAAHGYGTHQRNKVWLDDLTLWKDVSEKSPENGRGLMNYGLALMGRGEMHAALELYERAQVFTPNYSILEINLGIVKTALGDVESAEQHYERALRLTPDYAQGHYYYARWLRDRGRGAEAIDHLETALAISPGDLEANRLLIKLYAARGDEAALEAQVRRTLGIYAEDAVASAYAEGRLPHDEDGNTAEALLARGMEGIGNEDWFDAAQVYRQALRLDPGSATGWNNLGWARTQLGFYAEAIPCFREAYRLDPSMEVASNNAAWAEQQLAAQSGE